MHHLDRRRFDHAQPAVALSAVLAVSLATGGIGFWVGRYAAPPAPDLRQAIVQTPASIPARSDRPTTGIGQDQTPQTPEVDALSARLGDVQSQLMRLNALGERLVDKSGLSPEEFDFKHPVPQGGAEDGPVQDYTIKEIASELGSMVSLLKDRKRKLEILEEAITDRDLGPGSAPAGWPVRVGYITSNYGFRIHPTRHRRLFHQGVDFAAPHGTPIVAVADGLVTYSGRRNGYGQIVEVRHANGYVTRYAHNTVNLVSEGQRVRQGQQIAKVGATGTATGPHCHFEVLKNGEHLDPIRFAGRVAPEALAAVDPRHPG
jgi:murein DD-endopeptidase MepM/ murein hydrolase activator NlpD